MDAAPLQILFAARIPRQLGSQDTRYDRHWAIHFAIGGRYRLGVDDDLRTVAGAWVWTGHPGPRIRFAPSGDPPALHYRYALRGSRLAEWLAEELWPRRPLPIHDVPALQRCADRILEALDGDEPLDTRRRANAVEAFLLECHRQQRAAEPVPSWVLDVQRRLERDWNREVDYAALAARHHMPLHTLRRGFKRATGVAIHTWLLRERHRRAQALLLESDADLATIAERCGYRDDAYFSRQFKRFAGLSPGAFRRAAYG